MNRPIILVDLDNVVYDFVHQFAQWLTDNDHPAMDRLMEDHMDFEGGPKYDQVGAALASYKTWAVWEDWGIPKGEFIRWWRLGIEAEEIYAKGPIISGARKALWQLSDAEWDIHVATSRLTKFGLHDTIVENTASWLRNNNIPYRNLHFTDSKTAIRADAIVDDRADNMDTETHGRTFEFPANHNQQRFVTAQEQREYWEDIVDKLTTPEGKATGYALT